MLNDRLPAIPQRCRQHERDRWFGFEKIGALDWQYLPILAALAAISHDIRFIRYRRKNQKGLSNPHFGVDDKAMSLIALGL